MVSRFPLQHYSIDIFFSFFKMIQISIEAASVSIPKNFSNVVSARIFPIVFNPKSTKNIHNTTFTTFGGKISFMYFPFTRRMKHKKRLIRMEMISKTYISWSDFNLPPQVISYEINFSTMNTWKSTTPPNR